MTAVSLLVYGIEALLESWAESLLISLLDVKIKTGCGCVLSEDEDSTLLLLCGHLEELLLCPEYTVIGSLN